MADTIDSDADKQRHQRTMTSIHAGNRMLRAGFTVEQANKHVGETSWEKLRAENEVFLEALRLENSPTFWCPDYDDELSLVLGAVKNPPEVIQTEADYRGLLMAKVKGYLADEPNPERSIKALRSKLDLLGVDPTNWSGPVELAPEALIYRNPLLTQISRFKDLDLNFPMRAVDHSPEARRAYDETTLDEWINLL